MSYQHVCVVCSTSYYSSAWVNITFITVVHTTYIFLIYWHIFFYLNHRLLYIWTMHGKSPELNHSGLQHRSKLKYLVMRIELTQSILMPWLLNFRTNSAILFRMFFNSVTCFLRVTVSLLSRLQAVSKIHVPIYLSLSNNSEGRRNFSILWPAHAAMIPDSQERC